MRAANSSRPTCTQIAVHSILDSPTFQTAFVYWTGEIAAHFDQVGLKLPECSCYIWYLLQVALIRAQTLPLYMAKSPRRYAKTITMYYNLEKVEALY